MEKEKKHYFEILAINMFLARKIFEIFPLLKDVPRELFDDPDQKTNFTSMFHQITSNVVRIDFLKSFQRVRVIFDKPEHATGIWSPKGHKINKCLSFCDIHSIQTFYFST